MSRIKVFFTFAAFIWLWGCGFWALWRYAASGEIPWLGLLVNAWALPVWMLLRFSLPQRFSGEQREAKAFALVLLGLAFVLLTATEQNLPIHLSIYNLFVVLLYLFHSSAVSHPPVPQQNQRFTPLVLSSGSCWPDLAAEQQDIAVEGGEFPAEGGGYLLVMMRGSFCADSRAQLLQLAELHPRLKQLGIQLVFASTELGEHWHHLWPDNEKPLTLQLDPRAMQNEAFIAQAGVPLWLRLSGRMMGVRGPATAAACRPSAWLLDSEGYVVWRHLPANYRVPGSGAFLYSQVSRLED